MKPEKMTHTAYRKVKYYHFFRLVITLTLVIQDH